MFLRIRQVLAPFASSALCTSAASQLCCLAAVVGLPKVCCGFCRCRAPLGSSRQTLWWISCASFGSLSCTSSAADSLWFPPQHPELDHQLPPHDISTWRSALPKSVLKTLTPCYQVLAKNDLVCEPLVDKTFEKLGEHEWRNGVQKLYARVNVTIESALLPLWPGCPPRGRTHHVASNMVGTGALSTNTLEIDVFFCSVDGPTRPVSCQITLCWTWNQSDAEEKCKCASLSSVRTTFK